MKRLYAIISAISIIIRNFLLPNPFDCLTGQTIAIKGIEFPIIPEFLNIMAEAPLYIFSFLMAGLFYKKGYESPAKGSFLYLMFYCINVFALQILAKFSFSILSIILCIIAYVILLVIVYAINDRVINYMTFGRSI